MELGFGCAACFETVMHDAALASEPARGDAFRGHSVGIEKKTRETDRTEWLEKLIERMPPLGSFCWRQNQRRNWISQKTPATRHLPDGSRTPTIIPGSVTSGSVTSGIQTGRIGAFQVLMFSFFAQDLARQKVMRYFAIPPDLWVTCKQASPSSR
jgi:hypothetical protein